MMRVVGCFLDIGDTFVILRRLAHKPDGSTWGLPAGKAENGETDSAAIIRELYEETGYRAEASQLHKLCEYERLSTRGVPYVFVCFSLQLDSPHTIKLEASAHGEYAWVTAEECYRRNDLIDGLHELLRLVGRVA